MKVLPRPRLLSTWISPPRSREISRLIDRPRPVPPYLRLVVPSACWKASKMIFCFSFGDADAGVDDRERNDALGLEESLLVQLDTRATARTRRLTLPCSVNFKALDIRFFSTCCSR